jgi:excisionase family DNA binding protein
MEAHMSQLSPGPEQRPAPQRTTPLAVAPLEAARLLSVCISTIYNLMRAGQLDAFHSGKSRRITMRSIEAYIDRRLAVAKRKKGRG